MKYPLVKAKLKSALRDQGLTYADLGRKLGMTESGVKKLFQADDISLGRLEQICISLGLRLHELLDQEQNSEYVVHKLDKNVQAYFMKNRACFDFYFLLISEPKSLQEILSEYKIDKRVAYKYLRTLEKLKLLKWLPGDKIDLAVKGPWLLPFEGEFIQSLVREWASNLLQESLNGDPSQASFKSIRLFFLRPESEMELRRALSDLLLEFSRRSEREQKTHRSKVKPVRVLTVCREGTIIPIDRFK